MSAFPRERPARRVVVSVNPEKGESFVGYLCRVAGENLISGPHRLLARGTAWPPASLTLRDVSRLATELGCNDEAMHAVFARSHRDLLGPRMRIWNRRRVSPASLRLAAYHRSHWQVPSLPFCPETWGAVIETCPECQATLTWWTNAVDRCQRCGLDLKWVETSFAPEEDRQELGRISRMVIEGVVEPIFPEWVNFLSGPELFELIVLIGRALQPGGGGAPEAESRRLISGLRTLLGTPATNERLSKLNMNEPQDRFLIRMRSSASNRKDPVRKAIRLLLAPRPDDPGLRHLKSAREARGLMTATDMAARLQIEGSHLRLLVDAGFLGGCSSRGEERTCDWFSSEDLKQLQEVVHGRVSAWAWGRRMGLSGVDVRQLLAERLIDECADERLRAVFGGLQLNARRATEIGKSIRLCCEEARVTEAWIPVSRAFRGIGGGYKPWALLLKTAMRGDLVHGLGRQPFHDHQIGRFCVHPDDAAWIQGRIADEEAFPAFEPQRFGAYRPVRLSWGEVETLLNCNPADVARLLELGCIRRASADDGEGFDARSVELFSRTYVSSLELAALTGRAAQPTARRLARGGWSRSEIGFWPREGLSVMIAYLGRRLWEASAPCLTPAAQESPVRNEPSFGMALSGSSVR